MQIFTVVSALLYEPLMETPKSQSFFRIRPNKVPPNFWRPHRMAVLLRAEEPSRSRGFTVGTVFADVELLNPRRPCGDP